MWDDKQNIKTTNKERDKVESLQSDGSKTCTKKIKKKFQAGYINISRNVKGCTRLDNMKAKIHGRSKHFFSKWNNR